MALPKTGILHFVPTDRIAGSTPPGAPGSKDMAFVGPDSRESLTATVKHASEIEAELCDQHLDVGKTMGIRRVIMDAWGEKRSGSNQVIFEQLDHRLSVEEDEEPRFSLDEIGDVFDRGSAYDTAAALQASLLGEITQEITEFHRVFLHDEVLVVNLNFKSPIAQTPAANIKWTFANEAARVMNAEYLAKDIGKVGFQSDEKSWWVLAGIKDVPDQSNPLLKTPTWESQDLRSQIVAGCLTNRIVIFFLPDGNVPPYYAFIDVLHDGADQSDRDRDPKDQRAIHDIHGDGARIGWLQKTGDAILNANEFYTSFGWLLEWGGDLGFFEDRDALDAADFTEAFKRGHSGTAYYLEDSGGRKEIVIAHLIYGDPIDWSLTHVGSDLVPVGTTTDYPFTLYFYPVETYPYGDENNPPISCKFKVRSLEGETRLSSTQFLYTDD